MTVSLTTAKQTYTGDAVTTVYAYPFRILADEDLLVVIKDTNGDLTTKVLTTDYTVSGAGDASGGNVTFGAGDIPIATDTIIFTRNVDIKQETDYVEGDSFPANTHETALDKLTMIAQQTDEEVERSMKVDAAISGFDLTLPTPVADKFLAVNPGATAFIMADDTSVIGGLSKADGTIYVGDGTTIVAETGSTARDSLGLGTGDSPTFAGITSSDHITFSADGKGILDLSTNELLMFILTASAVNHMEVSNAATGNDPTLTAAGADTNVGLNLVPKGSGTVQAGGVDLVTTSSTDTLTNKTINTASNTITILEADVSDLQSYLLNTVEDTTPQLGGDLDTNSFDIQFDDATGIQDSNGNEQLIFQETASAVSHFEITNAATGGKPTIAAVGDDSSISPILAAKGAGAVVIQGIHLQLKYGSSLGSTLLFFEGSANGTNTLGIKAPDAITTSTVLTLPDGDGNADEVMKTDASGNLSWTDITTEVSAASDTVAGKIEIATAAEMETGTSTTLAVVPGRVQNHAGVAKVWLLMRYTTGTPGDIASHNVSSLTDTNTGEITVNFTTAMSSASYPAMVTRDGATSLGFVSTARSHATGSVLMDMRNDAGAAADLDGNLVIFGDQ